MLSNAYFLAKFRFDTAENEPAKNLQNFQNYVNASIPKEKTGVLSFFESFIFDAKADRFECNHPRDDGTRNVILRSFARSRVISVYHGA